MYCFGYKCSLLCKDCANLQMKNDFDSFSVTDDFSDPVLAHLLSSLCVYTFMDIIKMKISEFLCV